MIQASIKTFHRSSRELLPSSLLKGKQWASSCWQLVAAVEASYIGPWGWQSLSRKMEQKYGGAWSLGNLVELLCEPGVPESQFCSLKDTVCIRCWDLQRNRSVVQLSLMKGWAVNSVCRRSRQRHQDRFERCLFQAAERGNDHLCLQQSDRIPVTAEYNFSFCLEVLNTADSF